ncbi:hypothetical protein NE865_04621 [Phthorimaea operculella]|nr:hypothetical protein NE865_04621 [Phthorimaea operculella]
MFGLKIVLWISSLALMLHGSLSLRDVHMVIPEAVERGSTVEMRCQYDLEQEVLYSVKWYRGDREFCRYSPRDNDLEPEALYSVKWYRADREFCRYSPRDVPPLKKFPIPGIDVNNDLEPEVLYSVKWYKGDREHNGVNSRNKFSLLT